MTNKILVVDDEPDFCEPFGEFLVPGPGECPGKLVFQGRGHCNVDRIVRFDYPRRASKNAGLPVSGIFRWNFSGVGTWSLSPSHSQFLLRFSFSSSTTDEPTRGPGLGPGPG